MRQSLAFFIIIVLSFLYLVYIFDEGSFTPLSFFGGDKPLIYLDNTPLNVDVLQTERERAQGLSGRDTLHPTEGALFVFGENDYHGIWMKDMRISIDIIWIDENLKIIDIKENVAPSTFPRIFEPRSPARFVIETNSNFTSSFGIKVGDTISLPKRLLPEDLRGQ